MTTITAAGYIVQDKQGNAIQGSGLSVDEAWSQVCENAGPFHDAYGNEKSDEAAFTEDFKVYGASAALMAKLAGGEIVESWAVVRGVACTREEAEDAE